MSFDLGDNIYLFFMNLVKIWLNATNSIYSWLNTPMWQGGVAPLQLLAPSGLLVLFGILVVWLLV